MFPWKKCSAKRLLHAKKPLSQDRGFLISGILSAVFHNMPVLHPQIPGASGRCRTIFHRSPVRWSPRAASSPYSVSGRSAHGVPVQRQWFRPGERAAIRFVSPYRSPGRNVCRRIAVPVYSPDRKSTLKTARSDPDIAGYTDWCVPHSGRTVRPRSHPSHPRMPSWCCSPPVCRMSVWVDKGNVKRLKRVEKGWIGLEGVKSGENAWCFGWNEIESEKWTKIEVSKKSLGKWGCPLFSGRFRFGV